MASVNELLRDEAIRHQIALQGLSNNVVSRILAALNRSDKRIVAALADVLNGMGVSSFSMERLESLLTSIRAMSTAGYAEVERELTRELREFVAYEVSYLQQVLTAHVPAVVHVASVSADTVYSAAMARPFQGVLLKGVWKELDAKVMRQVRQTIAAGFVEGKTTDQIIRELRGTKARGYADGLLEVSRRDAEAVTRTALGHMARFAQDKTVEANADIIKAVIWSATLDMRTSPPCRARDGKQYTTAHKPIGHSLPWGGGPGGFHWRCRSHATYVMKSYKDLGIDVPEVEVAGRTRASLDGQIPAETTYEQWLQNQSAVRQDEVLGPVRGKLLRDGNLPMDRLYDHKGRYLSIEDLRRQDAEAFKRAGL